MVHLNFTTTLLQFVRRSWLKNCFFLIYLILAAERFPVDQQRIGKSLKYLDKNPQLCETMLNIPFVKRKMLTAEKVIHDEKSKRKNIQRINDAVPKSTGSQ